MDALFTVYLSLRKLFGALVPGILWLVLTAWLFPHLRTATASGLGGVLPGPVLPYIIGLIAAYLVGNTATWFSFRLLETIGDHLDSWTGRDHGPDVTRFRKWCERRLHLLDRGTHLDSLATVDAEARQALGIQEPPEGDPGFRWLHYGLYLRHHAPALAIEDREIEAETNFTAGIFLPLAGATIVLLARGDCWGLALVPLLTFLALRFQHLKHWEGEFLARSYWAARSERGRHTEERGGAHA